ncbi:MAG TPA: DUF5668 domain-containing protein [Clostridia bacterium]|nr:DUF5668 domain-containing protein [Clostridia bacterium]
MLKGRRVGTFSAGLVLIVFGFLFLFRILYPDLDYKLIFSLWPIVLVFLGIEVIVAYIVNKEEKMKYDGWAIALIIVLSLFAMCMGGAELIIDHAHVHGDTIHIN